ncbi:hypothetical protein BVG79_01773 [Ketogulonicigenium robustum]|uniref:Uncharacterized protein n=1 Tax=Ketogulonicigenium robustum TaxID=92947 RepID=A0A1W6P1F6_9RHOB|nr:hypothetical protein [Ketogulonicigenium robustum]ARO15117.1 hypothetical protein BVG79_01773 [Ketogulonicigenium robustum]
MTALQQYARLESFGKWRPSADHAFRDVVVSFGDATLVLVDPAGRPLAHWSLPAIRALDRAPDAPATSQTYTPDSDGDELLELDDALMIEALAKVMTALQTPQTRRLRLRLVVLGTMLTLALAAMLLLPVLVRNQALSVVPLAKRAELGVSILGHMQNQTGPSCRDPFGVRALEQLRQRVLGPGWPGRIVVLPGDAFAPTVLPGRTIVLSHHALINAADPAELASLIAATAQTQTQTDPLRPLLADSGFAATAALLTTGDLPQSALVDYAHKILARPAGNAASAPAPTGNVLNDNDWVGLLGICNS